MAKKLRVVTAQLNLLVGDLEGNLQKHIRAAKTARDLYKADLIVFPELSLTGYPPEDLLFRQSFIESVAHKLQQFKEAISGIYCVVGHPQVREQGLVNACSFIYNGSILGCYAKQHLPNYEVFDEYRYFVPGKSSCVIPIHGLPVGVVICEDLWHANPIQEAATQGARLVLVLNASPFKSGKHEERSSILSKQAKLNRLPLIYVNQVGGQDGLIFDGGSMVFDENGHLRQLAGFFSEVLHPTDCDLRHPEIRIDPIPFQLPPVEERLYKALVLGVRDYVEKNQFPHVFLGVSGGIDSALTLSIAVDALSSKRVHAVFMPSRFTSKASQEDAMQITSNLQVPLEILDLEASFKSFLTTLAPAFAGTKEEVTEENLQSRCRGVLLMALANKRGGIVLTTGNRSELAVGYTTLYGDMAGGLAVLMDVPKTLVYQLARYRNSLSPVIPENTLLRAPSAELALNQKDEDSLPPYSLLDSILELYLNQEKSLEELVALGFDKGTVAHIIQLITRNEYKRRQAPVGIRLNGKSFGKDRRYPVTSGFKEGGR